MIDVLNRQKEFEELANPHMNSLAIAARRMTGNAADGQDLTQNTYLKAYRFLHQFERGTHFKAWLLKIMANTYRNQYKKDSKTPPMFDVDDAETASSLQTVTTPESLVFDKLLDDDVIAALNALPENYRETIMLVDIKGLQYAEVVELLGCPIGTVMSRLHRGRKLLRKSLYEYAEQNGYLAAREH